VSVRHCLVVDDDEDFRVVLAGVLARRGYRVSTASDLTTGRQIAAQDPPDDVVLDLRLEQESGLELIEALRAANSAVRIVVLSGFASIATAVQAIKLGAVHYLTKPADADEIVAAFAKGAGDANVAVAHDPTPLEQLEWEHIQTVLLACEGNISLAAKRLGLHRRTLQRKLQKRPSGLG
jgi:two-component system, response regulator RegA